MTRSIPGLTRLDGTVARSSPAKVVAAGVGALALGTALLVAGPVALHPWEAGAELPPVTGPAGNGLIAFDRGGDIVVGDPLTGESRVIATGDLLIMPVFSPDGTRIAYGRSHILDPKGGVTYSSCARTGPMGGSSHARTI